MQTYSLTDTTIDWRGVAEAVRQTGAPVALALDGIPCGIILPPEETSHQIARYSAREAPTEAAAPHIATPLPTYLDLLRADGSLVPIEDGQPLEFLTMMNSSYIDSQQLYQFKNPATGQVVIYSDRELQQAIGRRFARVEFIPPRPKEFIERDV